MKSTALTVFIALAFSSELSVSAQPGYEQRGAAAPGPGQPMGYMSPGSRPMGPGMTPSRPPVSYGQTQSVPSTRFSSVPGSYQQNRVGSPAGMSANPSRGGASYQQQVDPRHVRPDTAQMQQALRSGDFDRLENDSRGVRSRADELQNMGPELSVQDRLKLPLIKSMYRQGADMVDEGRNSRDESKIRMGIQQINEANEKLRRMEPPQGNSRSGDRNARPNGSGRRERR